MSKRKYAKDVSRITYSMDDHEGSPYPVADDDKNLWFKPVPVRVIRESFYRKLIKTYEFWGHRNRG